MTKRVLIIRTSKLTVKNLEEFKHNDEVKEVRSALDFLILIVTDKFKTHLEFLDVQQVFDVLVDGRLTLQEISPEDEAAFLQKAQEHNGSVIQFQKD